MTADRDLTSFDCNCLAVRQAARHVTQYYDRYLAPTGLRIGQFGILAQLKRKGPLTINALAAELVIDRTTLGRNIVPLARDGLIVIKPGIADRRSKELHLTEAGEARYCDGRVGWLDAQRNFEAAFGTERAAALRGTLRAMIAEAPAPAGEAAAL